MKVSIVEAWAIQKLDPALIEAYLKNRNWAISSRVANVGTIWSFAEHVLFVPADHGVRDFTIRASETLQTLALIEERSEFSLYQDILFAWGDMISVRLPQRNRDADLNLSHIVMLANTANNIMLAAACSSVHPRHAHVSRRPRKALEYLNSLRAIQPSLDEPTITVLSPVSVSNRSIDKWSWRRDDFNRSVVKLLVKALEQTLQFTQREDFFTEEDYETIPENGVSANLYDAISDLLEVLEPASKLCIKIRYAPVRGEPDPDEFVFTHADLKILKAASIELRKRVEEGDESNIIIIGSTVGLRRPTHSRRGHVIIEENLHGGGTRRVRVELLDADYTLAAQAHSNRSLVRVSGILQRRGKIWLLKDPQEFKLVEK